MNVTNRPAALVLAGAAISLGSQADLRDVLEAAGVVVAPPARRMHGRQSARYRATHPRRILRPLQEPVPARTYGPCGPCPLPGCVSPAPALGQPCCDCMGALGEYLMTPQSGEEHTTMNNAQLREAANLLRTGSTAADGVLDGSLRNAARFLDRLVAGATVEQATATTPLVPAVVPYGAGSSDTYPSPAAGYGTEQLMAMAGTLAEQAEQAWPACIPQAQSPMVLAQISTAYALLALTQAVRDLPEALCELGSAEHSE